MAVGVPGKRLIWRFGVREVRRDKMGEREETAWLWCISQIYLALVPVVALIFREVKVYNKRK